MCTDCKKIIKDHKSSIASHCNTQKHRRNVTQNEYINKTWLENRQLITSKLYPVQKLGESSGQTRLVTIDYIKIKSHLSSKSHVKSVGRVEYVGHAEYEQKTPRKIGLHKNILILPK